MPTLQADLDLAVDAAQSRIGELDAAFQASAAAYSDALVEAVGAAAAATQDISIPVDADVSAAQAAIDTIDAEQPEVTVAVDDSELQAAADEADGLSQSLDGAGQSGQQAESGIGGAAAATLGLNTAMSAAKGETAAAGSGLLQMGGAAGATVGGFAAAGAALGVFFTLGEKSVAATERMTLAFGAAQTAVEHLDVGGLTGDLSDLAVQSGNSTAQLRQSLATLGLTVQSLGLTKRASADTAAQFGALALRATAMNPSLGEAGDAVQGLQRGLAQGGRFAAKFGLGFLNAGQIADRASVMFHKSSTELTTTEKAIAGAQIAVEHLGPALGGDFQRGISQTAVQFKALKAEVIATIATMGRPLVEPILAITKAALPLATAIGTVLGGAFQVLIPLAAVVAPVLEAFARGLTVIADLLGSIPIEVLVGLGVGLGILAVASGTASAAIFILGGAIDALTAAMAANPVTVWAVALTALVAAIGFASTNTEGLTVDVNALSKATDASLKKMAEWIAVMRSGSGGGFFSGAVKAKDLLDKLNDTFDKSIGAGKRFGQALVDAGAITEKEYTKALRGAEAGQKALKQTTDASSSSFDDQQKAAQAATDAIQKWIDAAVSQLPTVSGVLGDTGQALGQFGVTLDNALSPQAFLDNLNTMIDAVSGFQTRIAAIATTGFPRVAQLIIDAGPQIGGAYAKAFLDAPAEVQHATEDALGRASTLGPSMQALLGGPVGEQIRAGASAAFAGMPVSAGDAVSGVLGSIFGAGPAVAGAAAGAGAQGTAGLQTGLAPMPGAAGQAIGYAGTAIQGGAAGLFSPANVAGLQIGASFGDGIAGGIASRAGVIAAAARAVVNVAVEAAKNAGSPSEHLWHDAASEQVAAYAAGIENEQPRVVRASREVARAAADAARGPLQLSPLSIDKLGSVMAAAQRNGDTHVVLVKVDSFDDALEHVPVGARSQAAFLEGL